MNAHKAHRLTHRKICLKKRISIVIIKKLTHFYNCNKEPKHKYGNTIKEKKINSINYSKSWIIPSQ